MLHLLEVARRNTNEDGCQLIDAELRQLERVYGDLKLLTHVAKENVEKKLHDQFDLRKKAEDLSTWMRNTELKLGSCQEFGKDLLGKKLLLERIKVL